MCRRGQVVTMMGNVKSPYVGHRFLEEPPCMTRVLPVRGVVGHYIDRCIRGNIPDLVNSMYCGFSKPKPEGRILHD